MPSDYNIALNATAYYAKILSNHPLNTPVFRIKAIISADSNPASIAIVFFQTPAIQNILELEGGSFDTIFISAADLVTRGSESVYETSINLIQHPFSEFYDAAYPIKFNLSIYLLAGGYSEVYSAGLGYIGIADDVAVYTILLLPDILQPAVSLCMRVLVIVWRHVLMDSLVMEVSPLSLEPVIHVSAYKTH